MCGFFSSMLAIRLVKDHSTEDLLRQGMFVAWLAPILMLVAGGLPHCAENTQCPYGEFPFVSGAKHGWGSSWWVVTVCVAVMSATGFFTLPAMQTIVMQDMKENAGLA